MAREVGGDIGILFGAGEQPGRRMPRQPRRRADHLVGERGDGARERSVGRNPDPPSEPVAQPCRRGARGSEHEQLLGRPTARHPVGDELDEGRGLAGSRRSEHGSGCVVGQREHGGLRGVELEGAHLLGRVDGEPGVGHAATVSGGGDTASASASTASAPRFRPGRTPRMPRVGIIYAQHVDIRIGIANTARELSFESAQTPAEVEKIVADALSSDAKFLSLADDKGKVYVVPIAALAYVEIGEGETRRVGFVA